MHPSLIIFGFFHLIALIFLIEALRHIRNRSREFPVTEDKTTLPMGFIRLKHVVVLYVVAYLIWVVSSFVIYIAFVDSTLL